MFPQRDKHVISLIYLLLGYQIDQWVDEAIIRYLSIFSKENKLAFMYNYSQFLAKAMHEELMNITTEGVFKYSSVLVHILIFLQGVKLLIVLHNQDD